jgi:hypothetical protein
MVKNEYIEVSICELAELKQHNCSSRNKAAELKYVIASR